MIVSFPVISANTLVLVPEIESQNNPLVVIESLLPLTLRYFCDL